MDEIITVGIYTGRKDGRLLKRGEEFPPHLSTSGFSFFITGWNHNNNNKSSYLLKYDVNVTSSSGVYEKFSIALQMAFYEKGSSMGQRQFVSS